jgi:hypothetical protein
MRERQPPSLLSCAWRRSKLTSCNKSILHEGGLIGPDCSVPRRLRISVCWAKKQDKHNLGRAQLANTWTRQKTWQKNREGCSGIRRTPCPCTMSSIHNKMCLVTPYIWIGISGCWRTAREGGV